MALRQATQASEPNVRATMGRIARDEVRHAELAWSIDAWLRPHLTEQQRRRVQDARAAAVAELASDSACALPYAERRRLGLPSAREALHLMAQLDRSLGLSRPQHA